MGIFRRVFSRHILGFDCFDESRLLFNNTAFAIRIHNIDEGNNHFIISYCIVLEWFWGRQNKEIKLKYEFSLLVAPHVLKLQGRKLEYNNRFKCVYCWSPWNNKMKIDRASSTHYIMSSFVFHSLLINNNFVQIMQNLVWKQNFY